MDERGAAMAPAGSDANATHLRVAAGKAVLVIARTDAAAVPPELFVVGPGGYCSPRHPNYLEPSSVEVNRPPWCSPLHLDHFEPLSRNIQVNPYRLPRHPTHFEASSVELHGIQ